MIIIMSNDKKYYLEATKEFDEGRLDEALWSKTLSVNQGDETKAKYSYIKQRAKELKRGNFLFLIKRILRPLIILAIAALIIFGLIRTIDYIQSAMKKTAYEQKIKEEEFTRQQAINEAYRGFNCVAYDKSTFMVTTDEGYQKVVKKEFNFSLILNPLTDYFQFVYYKNDLPTLVSGQATDQEGEYFLRVPGDYTLGREKLQTPWLHFDKTTLKPKDKNYGSDYTKFSCKEIDHNEIRERVRKEQESIRSEYKITN